MSIIKDFKEKNPVTKNNEENYGNLINLAVKVDGVEENKYIIGERIDTKEKVRVYLRDLKNQQNGKHQRPDVAKLYSKVNMGILKFELCYLDQDGNYSSRWGKVLSKNDDINTVSIVKASLYYGKVNTSDEEYVQVALAFLPHKKIVRNMDEVSIILEKFLEPKTKGSKPFVFIKISDGEETEIIRVYGKTHKNENQISETLSGKESTKNFLDSEVSRILKELINNEKITVEIIPARVVYPGSNYKEKLLEQGFNRDVLSKAFNANKDDQNKKQGLGFLNCIVTTRNHADGTPFIVDITPINSDEPILPEDF